MDNPSFYWGVGIENTWMAEHAENNRPPHRLLDIYLLMQHYTMWREDLDRVADLGVNALRYSVPWYKSNPEPGVYDWRWISKTLDYIVNRLGIIPIIDLIHYGTPLWMENSVLNHEYPQRFSEYAGAFARQFKGLVNHYTPHNEPQVSALLGGANAGWPPYLVGVDGWSKVGLNVARGMILASQALRAELPDAVLISADFCKSDRYLPPALVMQKLGVTVGSEERSEFDLSMKSFPSSLAYGKVRSGSAFGRAMTSAGSSENELAWFQANAQLPDIVGHNYYPSELFDAADFRLEDALAGARKELAAGLQLTAESFERPVYLMETSAGCSDEEKEAWMQTCLDVILELRSNGVPVVGMNWWPLFEVCRWDYRDTTKTVAESIRPGQWNNGLYRVEEQFDGTLKREPTRAVAAYRKLTTDQRL